MNDSLYRFVIRTLNVVLNSKTILWLAPLSVAILGTSVAFAIQKDPVFSIFLVLVVSFIAAAYLTFFSYFANKRSLQVSDIGEFPQANYRTVKSRLAWRIEDPEGKFARLEKYKKLEALVPMAALPEYWWGDGEPPKENDFNFLNGRHSLGRTYTQGSRVIVDVLLDREYSVGEQFEVYYSKTVKDSFTKDIEWVETVISTKTEELELEIVFPSNKNYKSARGIRRIGDHSKVYMLDALETSGRGLQARVTKDGRGMLYWHVIRPVEGAVYAIEWDW